MTTDGDGGAIVAWPDGRIGGCENAAFTSECDVYAQRISSMPELRSCGDPTGDGKITTADALLALKAAVGSATCAPAYCDVDIGGTVEASDATAILRRAVGAPIDLTCSV